MKKLLGSHLVLFLVVGILIQYGEGAGSGCGAYFARTASRYCWKYCEGTGGLWCYTWKGCNYDSSCPSTLSCHAGISCDGERACVSTCPIPETSRTTNWKKPNRASNIPVEGIPGSNLLTGTFYTIENGCGLLVAGVGGLVECSHDKTFRENKKEAAEWMLLPSEEPRYYAIINKNNKLNNIYFNHESMMTAADYTKNEFQPGGAKRGAALWKFINTTKDDPTVHTIQAKSSEPQVLITEWVETTDQAVRHVAKLLDINPANPAASWTFTLAGVALEARMFEMHFKESIADVMSRNKKPQLFQRKIAYNPSGVEETTTFTEEVTTDNKLQLSFAQKLGLVHTISFEASIIPGVFTASSSTSISAEVSAGQVIDKSETRKKTFSRQVTVKPYTCTEMTYIRHIISNAQIDFSAKLSVSGKSEGMTWGGILRDAGFRIPGETVRNYVEITGFEGEFVRSTDTEAIYELNGKLTASLATDEQFFAKDIPLDGCKKENKY